MHMASAGQLLLRGEAELSAIFRYRGVRVRDGSTAKATWRRRRPGPDPPGGLGRQRPAAAHLVAKLIQSEARPGSSLQLLQLELELSCISGILW